jgi:hypothetical protein
MAERQAQLLEMTVGQLDQRLAIDRVAGEQLYILAEALRLQPGCQIGHGRPPRAPPAKYTARLWAAFGRLSTDSAFRSG